MNEELKVIISAEISKFKSNVEKAKSEITSFSQQIEKASASVDSKFSKMGDAIKKSLAVVTTAAGAGVAALYGVATSTASTADEIDKMSQKIGISREAYQEWNYICSQSGVEVSIFQNGVKTLTSLMDSAANGTESAQQTFEALGLTWEDGTGKLKSQEQMMEEAITALANMEDSTERAKLATELFGKAGTELAPILNSGSDGIDELRQRCHELGLVMSDETIDAGVKLGDTIADVKSTFGSIGVSIGEEVMPIIQNLADMILEKMPEIKEAVGTVFDIVSQVVSLIVDNIAIIGTIAGIITTITTAIGLYNAVAAVKAAMDAAQVTTLGALITAYAAQAVAMIAAIAPYVLIVAAIAAVIAIIVLCVKHWDEIKEAVSKAWDAICDATSKAVDAVVQWFNDMKEKISSKIEEIKTNVSQKWEAIKTAISDKVKAAKETVVETFENIKTGISEKITSAKESVVNLFTAIKDNMKSKITEAKENVLSIFDGIKQGISDKIEAAKEKVRSVIDAIKGFFNFKFTWPSIPMPHFSISPSGWKIGDLLKGSIPSLGISWYAEGGVFDTPTLFGYGNGMLGGLGEHGAEAVVPLENNTEWLDRIAERLYAHDSNTPIVLEVDGTVFAKTSIKSINDLTRRTGKLQLALV